MRVLLFALALLLAAGGAAAQNMRGLLNDAPSNFFNDEDNRLFLEAWGKALEETPDQQSLAWQNPKTGHGGELTTRRSFEWRGYACKEVRIRNQAQGRKGDSTLNACRVEGKWRLVSEEQLKK